MHFFGRHGKNIALCEFSIRLNNHRLNALKPILERLLEGRKHKHFSYDIWLLEICFPPKVKSKLRKALNCMWYLTLAKLSLVCTPLPPLFFFAFESQAWLKYPWKRNAKILLMSYLCIWLHKVKGKHTLYLSQANNSQQCQRERTILNLTLTSFLVGCKTCSTYEVLHNYRRL